MLFVIFCTQVVNAQQKNIIVKDLYKNFFTESKFEKVNAKVLQNKLHLFSDSIMKTTENIKLTMDSKKERIAKILANREVYLIQVLTADEYEKFKKMEDKIRKSSKYRSYLKTRSLKGIKK